ncbi:Monoamine regulon transcriptional regulator [Marinobacterium lacunae]|uniref:Monoamine regulon transcriptional regulator n=1 Tax=Marinobacterium lacunae TaxID=1232683 RepID=A0A081G393_9GAMM|nr:helix-turn-helix transcriptional regulator [Marinobacterium lacunae]KEA65248.1 Monoamine regulon transcriptional regulator [Marinobacterium lacunae]
MMSLAHTDPREFQEKSLELVRSLVSLSSSAFFLVDPDMQHRGAVLYNLNPDAEKAYSSEYGSLDPLNPERFANSDEVLVTLDSRIAPHHLKQTLYYQNFMVPFNHRYVADMFFRREGRIIAGLSMMREESLGNFRADELALLRKVQPFLEYALNAVYLPRREREREGIADKYGLTERELDVLELVLRGSGNKEIAAQLTLGEATVKTHLIRIFRKTDVKKRSELVAKVLLDLNS